MGRSIRTDLKEIGCEDMRLDHVAQIRDQWQGKGDGFLAS